MILPGWKYGLILNLQGFWNPEDLSEISLKIAIKARFKNLIQN